MNISASLATEKTKDQWIRCRLLATDNEKYVKRDQALIIKDDHQRFEGMVAANRSKAGAPFQYAESLFAILTVVKSRTGLPCRHLQGLESASIHEDSKPSNAAARISPFNLKCTKHMWIKGSIYYHYYKDVFPCVQF